MGAEAVLPSTRDRLAAHFSELATKRRLGFWVIVASIWMVMFMIHAVSRRWGGVFLSGVNLATALLYARKTRREGPRMPESFSDHEISEAERSSGRCPRCSELVLSVESRCVRCGSVAANFVITSSGVGAILLVTSLTIMGFALYGWISVK